MFGPRMLCVNGWGLSGPRDALDCKCSSQTTAAGATLSASQGREIPFVASMPVTPLPSEKRDRRDVFGCETHDVP